MSEGASKERILTMCALGAEVLLTAVDQGIEGARDYAKLRIKMGITCSISLKMMTTGRLI